MPSVSSRKTSKYLGITFQSDDGFDLAAITGISKSILRSKIEDAKKWETFVRKFTRARKRREKQKDNKNRTFHRLADFDNDFLQLLTKNGPTSFFDSISILEASKLKELWSADSKTASLEKLVRDFFQNIEELVKRVPWESYFDYIPRETLDRLEACVFAVDRKCHELDIDLGLAPFSIKDELAKMRKNGLDVQGEIIDVEGSEKRVVRRPRLHPNTPDRGLDVRLSPTTGVSAPESSIFSTQQR